MKYNTVQCIFRVQFSAVDPPMLPKHQVLKKGTVINDRTNLCEISSAVFQWLVIARCIWQVNVVGANGDTAADVTECN